MLLNTNECILHLLYQALCGYISQCLKNKKMSHLSKSSEVKYFYNDFGDRTITGLLTTGLLTTEHMTTDLLTSGHIQQVF